MPGKYRNTPVHAPKYLDRHGVSRNHREKKNAGKTRRRKTGREVVTHVTTGGKNATRAST